MKRSILLFIFLILLTLLFGQNTHPIILIHGFLGWGRDEMLGYYYWGGKMDLEKELRSEGFDIYTVSVGPISSNWDRAIEAFYQIKGGQVDYGNSKTIEEGLIQRPKNKKYNGLYSAWSAENPIHIISHSQGGQTARMLEKLLKESFSKEESPLLSAAHNGWIKSITTISTTHNGTTLVPIMLDIFPFALNLAPWFGGIDNKTIDALYSFDLEHWGLERGSGESLGEYFKRLSSSSVSKSKNLCSWDLSIEGANEFNNSYITDNEVYYFSFSTFCTKKGADSNFHVPDNNLSYHLWPTSLLIGKYIDSPGEEWYENDGIVNSVSMSHPEGSLSHPFSGVPTKGVWQTLPNINMDHQAVIGHNVSQENLNRLLVFYTKHCKLLSSIK